MSKKLIALILVLPMVLMMTLFSAVNTVSLKVKVPVSKIEIMGDDFVSLDIDKNERYYVDYVVYPTSATNKNVSFSVEPIDESQPKAELDYKDGYIYPKSAGSAYACFSTADGGYRAKFHVVVKETELKEISCSVTKNLLNIGENVEITTEFNPYSATDKALEYLSSNNSIVSVDDNGTVTATGKGYATVTVRSLSNENIFDTIDFVVNSSELLSLGQTEISTGNKIGEINLTIDNFEEYSLDYEVCDEYGNELIGVLAPANVQKPFIDLGDGNFKFDYEFVEDFYGTAVVHFTLTTPTQTVKKTCKIVRVQELTAEFKSQGDLYLQIGTTNFNWKNNIDLSPKDAVVSYSVEYSNNNLSKGKLDYLTNAIAMGKTKVTVNVQSIAHPSQNVVLEKDVYIYPENLYVNQNAKGIEDDVYTIGKTDVNGKEINHSLTVSFGKNIKGDGFNEIENIISFDTSEPEKVKVENSKIKILDDTFNGIVDINAKINLPNPIKSEKIKVRCVGNGVEVDNFIDLHTATKLNKAIVLQGDIVNDFGKDANGNNFYQGKNLEESKIDSTYDTRFYSVTPQVITLLQFKNNLYGNGHVINADNVTMQLDSTGALKNDALFRGPLDFVAMGNMASVKAQDNICFAVFEGVTINNVELKGCSLQTDQGGEQDLNDLNYVGTVVEVLGDKVNIEYSRINNGRTVLRAFGDIKNKEKEIHVSVKNCVLSYAREFIVRIGSNLLVNDTRDVSQIDAENYQAPDIDPSETFDFPVQQNYNPDTFKNYEDKYINTFVSIENTVMQDSGIFCIGIDSHFAGPMLLDALGSFSSLQNSLWGDALKDWKGLSSTSYGAKLTFNGDVRMYDWKKVDNVDSSTLIEMGIDAVESLVEMLKFDLKEMIGKLSNTQMVCLYNGSQYVHGGIVFFGGGKNYGLFEDKSQSFKGLIKGDVKLDKYSISLGEVDKDFLEKAAGDKPFYFALYSANSKFDPEMQENILSGSLGDPNNCIYFR